MVAFLPISDTSKKFPFILLIVLNIIWMSKDLRKKFVIEFFALVVIVVLFQLVQ